jgi:3-isopropylmalate dehydrogenase
MALRYSFSMTQSADLVERAVADVLADGKRTGDIMQEGMQQVSTAEMGEAVVAAMQRLAA